MTRNVVLLGVLTVLLAATPARSLQSALGQSLLPAGDVGGLGADPAAGNSPDDNAYADGVRAINTGRWADAIGIFTHVAAQGSGHAEGALYWKAYAENKQGQSSTALDTCGALRQQHPGSSWIEECGALEIEIRARSGQPVAPKTEQDDELKLLALASLMQRDEKKALAQIDQILNSDASEKLKQGALFIMGEHHSDTIYPQIARLSFVDGDVRIERGQGDPHRKDVTWEAAAAGVPLESGYNIVTGDGRAEVELEDASTLYLAPNSVLTINDLSTTGGVPHSDLALLSGTVTLHVRPYVAGEVFILQTPTDSLMTRYPETAYFRISSYTDGMAFTPMGKGTLGVMSGLGAGQEELTPGQTLYFKSAHRVMDAGPIQAPDFGGWDHWVADRVAARTEATAAVLKASGLSAPVPGLADLNGKGYFFNCEPYGTCWQPLDPVQSQGSAPVEALATVKPSETASSIIAQDSGTQTSTPGRNIRIIGSPARSGRSSAPADLDAFFPCIPDEVRTSLGVLPGAAQFQRQPVAWQWAVCHSGSWIYQGNRYVWVVGHRHHRPCVHWVKSGHTIAFVPIHPRDVKDHLPVNRKEPVLAVDPKNGRSIERLQLGNEHPIELLREPPREFRAAFMMPLARATAPHMEAHQLKDYANAKGEQLKPAGIPITFDAKSQNFMMPHQVMQGGRPVSIVAPISNRGGSLQSHSGAFNGSGSHGGFSGGGGAHGGSSASSSGGGSHSSGSSGAAASSASASSSASSSGGSHK